MNCQEALSLLYDIIDKEASNINTKEVKDHLDKCKHCFEVYRIEQAVQDLIDEKLSNNNSTEKIDTLKNKILTKLDEADGCCDTGNSKKKRKMPAMLFAVAATIVILLGAALITNRLNNHEAKFIPLERAHWAVISGSDQHQSGDVDGIISTAFSIYRYQIDDMVGDFKLVGGYEEEILDASMMHFIYKDNGNTVSVFLASDDQFSIPDDLAGKAIDHNNHKLFDHVCKGCRMVYHRQGSTIVITASTDNNVELLDFIPGRSSI